MPTRCAWAATPLGIAYHDAEWGVPLHDDRRLFEFLILEGAQAGLSWELILQKREAYRVAFDGFDPEKVAAYGDHKVAELLANPGIVRNRLKVGAAIGNARAFLEAQREFGSFDAFIWGFAGGGSGQERLAVVVGHPRQDAGVRCHEQGTAPARVPVCRAHHLLRLHAGHRHGQRPYNRLLPLRRRGVNGCGTCYDRMYMRGCGLCLR